MKSPFPGMDPFIEARGLWNDLHGNLIAENQRALNAGLRERCEALIFERTFVDLVDSRERRTEENPIRPDVHVDRTTAAEGVFEHTFEPAAEPPVSVPLWPPEADFQLDLHGAINRVVEGSRDDWRLRYDRPSDPPLSNEKQTFF
jgi:hypothetical protein